MFLFLRLQVLDGQESIGFERLVEQLNHHRCVITVSDLIRIQSET